MDKKFTSYDIETGERANTIQDKVVFDKPKRSQTKEMRLRLTQFLNVGRMKKTYYLSEAEVSVETIEIITKFAYGTDKDVEFLAKSILYAREVGHMRSVPILALVVLSSSPNTYAKTMFRSIFDRIVLTGKDLKEFIEIVKSDTFRGFGKSIQKTCANWIQNMTPYEAIKYGSKARRRVATDTGSRIDTVNLGDIIKLCHVKPTTPVMNGMFKWLMGVNLEGRPLPPQIEAYEKFKTLPEGDPERAKLVGENSLPFEVIAPQTNDKEVWKQLCLNAPFMNLVKNLKNFHKRGLFDDKECLDHVCNIISNENTIKNSKMFPFRFVTAFDEMIEGPVEILEALEDAIELSYENLPDISKKVAIIVDQSGSMAHSKVSPRSSVSILTVANTFAAILYKKSKKAYMIPFARKADIALVSKKNSTLDIADSLLKVNVGNETNMSAPFKKMLAENLEVDVIIAITDNNSWLDSLAGSSTGDALEEYLVKVKKDTREKISTQMFFINTELGQTTPVDHQLDNACFLYGWSDNIIKFILENIQKKSDPLKQIDIIEI